MMKFIQKYLGLLLIIVSTLLVSPTVANGARTDALWDYLSGGNYMTPNASSSGVNLLIQGSNKYLNFNTVTGSSGYGFRDNAGVMEFKNSGGAWTGVGTGGGGGGGTWGSITGTLSSQTDLQTALNALVPYTGATTAVNLGSNSLTTTGNISGNSWLGSTAVRAGAAGQFYWNGRSIISSSADGVVTMTNQAATSFGRLTFGGTTSSFPALKLSSTDIQARLADDSAYTNLDALAYKLSGSTVLSGTTLGASIVSSSLTSHGTITSGGLGTGAVIGGVTMTLGSDANYDTYYRNSSGVLTRLANGTTGQFLGANTGAAPTWQTPAGGGGLTVGTSTIASGTTGRVLYDNAGTLGEMTNTGTGTVNVLQNSPTLTTPVLGVATGTSLALGTSLSSGFVAQFDGSMQLGTAFSYAPTAGQTDFVVGSLANNARFLFGQSASTYGGITWNYNATPANTSITFGYNVAGTLTGVTFDPSGNGVFSQGLKVTTPSNVSTSVVTTDGTQTLTNKSIALSQITGLGTGVATWLGTPSSANLASAITDETGSGVAVFGTSPTFTTQITSPIVLGGTGTTQTLTFQTTSGVGTTNADMIFKVGNNGATEALRITNAGALSTSFNISSNSILAAGILRAGATQTIGWNGRSNMTSPADSQIVLFNNASTDFARLMFGGTTSSFPSLKRSSTAIAFRLADDSADAPITAANITTSGRFLGAQATVASANDITLTTGNVFQISGTTQINTIATTSWTSGSMITLQFAGSLTVANNTAGTGAVILLAGGANFSATANDTLTLIYNGTNWSEVSRAVI